jgi:site-specific recombinase XerD
LAKRFKSYLAPQLSQFIAYRKNLGYASKTLFSHLKTFDRYVAEKKIDEAILQPAFFLEMRAALKIEPASINSLFYSLSAFFQFLLRKGYYFENPIQDIPPLPQSAFIPFIFSSGQTDQLLAAICKRIRKTPRYYLKDLAEYMAVLLLSRCGLRIKEPLRLKLNHYRSRERTIYIEKTKFKKDRLIPVPHSVAKQIENYLAARNALLIEDQNPHLLVSNNQKGLIDNRVRLVFHRAVKDIGLDRPRQVLGNTIFSSPTPHSLRHSFAVNTLKAVRKRGQSPQNALPVLAVYMGHSEYKHTIKYLKVIDAEHRHSLFKASQKEGL